jgi:hypothetical protein
MTATYWTVKLVVAVRSISAKTATSFRRVINAIMPSVVTAMTN